MPPSPSLGQQVSPARITRTGIAVAYLDRLSACREPLQRAIQHGREGGAITSAIEALFLLGQDAFHTGRWKEAQELVDEGLQLCAAHGYDLLAWPGRLTAALLAATRGDCQQAIDTARDMDAWAAPRRAGIIGAYASHIRGLTALGQEDFETAFHNAAAISPPGVLAPYAPHALWVFHDLVEAAMYTGREAAAAAHIAAARDCRLDRLSPRLRLVVLASAAIAEPGTDGAALEDAITEPGSDRWPFDLARIQLAYGSQLRRIKRTTDARQQLGGRGRGLPPARGGPVGGPGGPRAASHRHHRLQGRRRPGLADAPATADRAAGGGGAHQQGDRGPAVPVPADGLDPPVPGVSQARDHLEGGAAGRAGDLPPE